MKNLSTEEGCILNFGQVCITYCLSLRTILMMKFFPAQETHFLENQPPSPESKVESKTL